MQADRMIFLGTGDAFSAGGRYQAAYLIQGGEVLCFLTAARGPYRR